MTSLIEDYVNRVDFDSYEDFHKNFKNNISWQFLISGLM